MLPDEFYGELARGMARVVILLILLAGLLGAAAGALIFWLVS